MSRRGSSESWGSQYPAFVSGLAAIGQVLDSEHRASEQRSSIRPSVSSPGWFHHWFSVDSGPIVIAVDAKPDRVGGLLRFPRTKRIYFYSIEWSQVLDFPDPAPEKYEMVNTLLALELFTDAIQSHRQTYTFRGVSDLECKGDNTFCSGPSSYSYGADNEELRDLFSCITGKLKEHPFHGTFKFTRKQVDNDMKIVEKLSRTDCTADVSLPSVHNVDYSQYTHVNFSITGKAALDKLPEQIPKSILKRRKQEDTLNWRTIAVGVAGGMAVAGLTYGMSHLLNYQQINSPNNVSLQWDDYVDYNRRKEDDKKVCVDLETPQMPITPPEPESKVIIIAVDANSQRAGGLLRIPDAKAIFFYSVEWDNAFNFTDRPQSDKIRMVNALLALEMFQSIVANYRRVPGATTHALVCKIDNTFCLSENLYLGTRNDKYGKLLENVNEKLREQPFAGEWRSRHKRQDMDMKIAEKLSESDHSMAAALPEVEDCNYNYEYSLENLSIPEQSGLQKMVVGQMPKELLIDPLLGF